MIPRLSSALGAMLLAAALLAAPAPGAEVPSHPFRFEISGFEPEPHRPEDLEGPCGLALDSQGDIYVANYYHDEIDVFDSGGHFINRMLKEEPTDGPCALAVDAAGRLYVNNFHRNVLRYALSGSPPLSYPPNSLTTGPATTIDSEHSTGAALDPASGNLYVDDRTYIAEYKAPIEPGAKPAAKIGLGNLKDGYGVAVSDFAATKGFLYVPDAASGTVKVYDPAVNQVEPVEVIDGQGTPQAGFASLVDSAVAVDDSDGHVFVTDNLQSLDTEHPRVALDEFNFGGDYRGQLPRFPTLLDAEPSGVAIDNSGGAGQGDVYVTSGNTEKASVYAYGPTGPAHTLTVAKSGSGSGTVKSEPAGIDCGPACVAEYSAGAEVALAATPAPGSAFAGWTGACAGTGSCQVTMSEARSVGAEFEAIPQALLLPAEPEGAGAAAAALGPSAPNALPPRNGAATASEVAQKGNLRVSFEGKLSPHALPRRGAAPVAVSIGGHISTTDGANPPQLRTIAIQINSHGHLDHAGLPACEIRQIQPSTNQGALAACRSSLIGAGSFSANVVLPQQAPFPSNGKVLAFNGTFKGRPAILAHVYGIEPVPTSYTLPFQIKASRGTFGTVFTASLPQTTGEWGFVTGIQMTLRRRFAYRGRSHSYLSAGCPAPAGFQGAFFPLARTTFGFAGGKKLTTTLTRDCRVRG